MDGAIVLNANATKIGWANVQLMPDPTILSLETGTRHRTAERVSKQTDALVIALSPARDVVSLYVDGAKYMLVDIPVVLAKANQALATLDKYRGRLDQVSTRLTALEFEGGATLHDVLTVLQRAELVTRMAVEIERYIVELGTEGRLIEMQLEETMVGRRRRQGGARPRLPGRGLRRGYAPSLDQLARLPHQDLLDFGRLAELLGYDRKLNTLDHPVSRRGATGSSGAFRGCRRSSSRRSCRRSAGWTRCSPRPTRSSRPSRASGRSGRRTSARAFAGCRRSTSWIGTCRHRAERAWTRQRVRTRRHHYRNDGGRRQRGPRAAGGRRTSSSRSATTSCIRIMAPARSSRRREGDLRREAGVPRHQDPPQRHDRHGPVRERRQAGLRRVIDEETVKKVLAVLSDEVAEIPKNWNRRFKHNRDKIKTGDIYELAEVVRNLAIREHEKGLSTGEKQMFTRAKKILASELMYALDMERGGGRGASRRPARGRRPSERRGRRLAGNTWRSRCSWPPAAANAWGPVVPKAFVGWAGRPHARWSLARCARHRSGRRGALPGGP